MQGKGEEELSQYVERVDSLYKNKIIGKVKRDKLLMPESKIPQDFIERQLRESQYISRKAKEILEQVCRSVWATSGNVTAHLRKLWGWDDVLMNLQLPKYRELGLTEWAEWETNDGQKHKKETIKEWTKRDDHRHHAIDALTIACTKQGFIQRLNTLSSQHTRDEMYAEVEKQSKEFREKLNLLDAYLILQRPFNTKQVEEKAAEILVSFKAGKKVATYGKRKVKKGGKKVVVQEGIIVPRGALSEESVYGKIKTIEKNKSVKYLFENRILIFKPYIKSLVEERLAKFDGNSKKALASLKKEPIYLDKEKKTLLEYGTCFKEEVVIKYPLGAGQGFLFDGKEDEEKAKKDLESVIDKKVREKIAERLFINDTYVKTKEALKELDKNPIFLDDKKKIPIKTVRCFTGLSTVEPVKKDGNGSVIGFVKPGNNHHIAFYKDENGKKAEHSCTFWHAVNRKKYGIPVIIRNPKEVWDKILSGNGENKYPDSFLQKLPKDNWTFENSLQQNEMFVLGVSQEEFVQAMKENNKKILSDNLYRVQKIASNDFWFRHHLETQLKNSKEAQEGKRYYRLSLSSFEKLNPQKVKINNLGEVIEYSQ